MLRPDGELRFYEHVVPRCQPKRLLLQVIDRSGLWPRIAGGCHPARDTTEAIMQAGFDIEEIERFGFSAAALPAADPTHPRDRTSHLSRGSALADVVEADRPKLPDFDQIALFPLDLRAPQLGVFTFPLATRLTSESVSANLPFVQTYQASG